MSCEEDGCHDGQVTGMCLTCTSSNYYCVKHLSKHLKLRHKIKQLEDEEIENWKRIKEDLKIALKRKEIFDVLHRIQYQIIKTSQLFISRIKEITNKSLNDLKNRRKYIDNALDFESYFKKSLDYYRQNVCKLSTFTDNQFLIEFQSSSDTKSIKEDEQEEKNFEARKINTVYMIKQGLVLVGIYKAHINETGKFICIKECISPTEDLLQGYIEEAKILKKLSGVSNNFLEFYGSKLEIQSEGKNKMFVFTIQMEYVETTLESDKLYRDLNNKPYNDIEILKICKQIILAFNQITKLNIIHGDIKPSNIMITNDLVIKIIDFNTAKIVINETSQPSQAAGTKDYMSPEIRKAFEIRNQSQYISPEEKEFIEKMEQESIKNFKGC